MIAAKELRLGNWILDHKGMVRQVAYTGDTIGLDLGNDCTQKYQHDPIFSQDIKDLNPVPLTPEILEKAGWHLRTYPKKEMQEVYGGTKVYFLDGEQGEEFVLVEKSYGYILCDHSISEVKPLTSLHQLQNLYFAFKQEELNIEL